MITILVVSAVVIAGLSAAGLSTFGFGGRRSQTYSPAIERYSHWSFSYVDNDFGDFKLEVADYQPDGGHVKIRLSGFPAGLETLRGIDYLDTASQEDCQEDLFESGSGRIASGYQHNDADVSQYEQLDVSLPIFTNDPGNYLCVRVEIWDYAVSVPRQQAIKLFVTEQTLGSMLAGATRDYEELSVKDSDRVLLATHFAAPAQDSLDERFRLYATLEPIGWTISGGQRSNTVGMSFNMPGKLRLKHGSDIQGFEVESVEYAYVNYYDHCGEYVFSSARPSQKTRRDRGIEVNAYDNPGMSLEFDIGADSNGGYLCIKAEIKGDVSAGTDSHHYKIFSYAIDLPE